MSPFYAQINKKIEETQERLEQIGLGYFHIDISVCVLPKGIAGRAWGDKKIDISSEYISVHTQRIIERTVPHEVAHCYVSRYYPNARKGHGREWKRLMEALGCEQSRHHDMDLGASAPSEVKKVHEIKKVKEFADVIWNDSIKKYEGFVDSNIVFTDKSYGVIKKFLIENHGFKMFNIVTP